MKIDKTNSALPKAPLADAGSSAARNPGNASPADTASTNVTLGASTARLRTLENASANAPVIDAKKVAEIKQAISEGRFQVNSALVADRLINTVQDLISASKR